MARVKFRITGMDCATCARIVRNALEGEPGVEKVVPNYVIDAAAVEYDPGRTDEETIRRAIESRTSYKVRRLG